jgi:hypothetical protein
MLHLGIHIVVIAFICVSAVFLLWFIGCIIVTKRRQQTGGEGQSCEPQGKQLDKDKKQALLAGRG